MKSYVSKINFIKITEGLIFRISGLVKATGIFDEKGSITTGFWHSHRLIKASRRHTDTTVVKFGTICSLFSLLLHKNINCKYIFLKMAIFLLLHVAKHDAESLNNIMYVGAPHGIKVFTTNPFQSTDKKRFFTVPFGVSVTIDSISEDSSIIDDLKGVWYRINYENKQGWSFSEFLVHYNPMDLITIFNTAYQKEWAHMAAYVKKDKNKNILSVYSNQYYENKQKIGNHTFRVLQASRDFLLFEYIRGELLSGIPALYSAAYGIKTGAWELIHDRLNKVQLAYLDKGNSLDLIGSYGCCSTNGALIYLGSTDSNNDFSKILDTIFTYGLYIDTIGNCEALKLHWVNLQPNGQEIKGFIRFGCKEDSFIYKFTEN